MVTASQARLPEGSAAPSAGGLDVAAVADAAPLDASELPIDAGSGRARIRRSARRSDRRVES